MCVLGLLSTMNTSSNSLICARDGVDLEADCWPGQKALNFSFVQLRDVCAEEPCFGGACCVPSASLSKKAYSLAGSNKKDFVSGAFIQKEGWFSWMDL